MNGSGLVRGKCEQVGRGGQGMGNGGNAEVTAGQEGVAGSEMTGELVYGKQIENV